MALSIGRTLVDQNQRENKMHGSFAFPAACYDDDLSREEVPWHWHDELEVVVVEEGETIVVAGSERHIVRAGEGFVINSGVLHSCRNTAPGSACRYHSIVFSAELVGGSAGSVFWNRYLAPLTEGGLLSFYLLSPDQKWESEVLNCIEEAWKACVMEKAGFEFVVREKLSRSIFLLTENLQEDRVDAFSSDQRDEQRMKKMLSYVQDNYCQDLTVKAIAASASVSESEALRCFRRMIGMTPIHYVKKYRIGRAMEMLTRTDEKIGVISASCGFQDTSYFGKTFREIGGMTPSEYRSRMKGAV